MATIKAKLARVDADHKTNAEKARAFRYEPDTYPVGICIQVSVMIPSLKKPGKGVVMQRAEGTSVMVDPTDIDTMMTVIRGSLANAQLTMPEALMGAEDNEIYEVDLKCPKCKRGRKAAKRAKSGKEG